MKTLAQSLLTALLLSTATFASAATTHPTTSVNPTVTTSSYKAAVFPSAIPSKLNVYVERTPGQAIIISLKASDGTLLGKQSVGKKQGNFHFQFDLSELEDGTYNVEITSGNDVSVQSVTVTTQAYKSVNRTITLN